MPCLTVSSLCGWCRQAGAVTVLYFANRLLQFPMALVTHAIGTALYPDLARGAVLGWQTTGDSLRQAGAVQAALLLPAAVGLILCAEPLVQLIYFTGAFLTRLRCNVAYWQPNCLRLAWCQLARINYSLRPAMLIVINAAHGVFLIAVGLNLTLNLILVMTPLAEAGLALASALSALITTLMYSWLLKRRGAQCWQLVAWLRPGIGCLLMALAVWSWLHLVLPNTGTGAWSAALRLISGVVIGMLVYAAVAGRDAWRRYRSAQQAASQLDRQSRCTQERPYCRRSSASQHGGSDGSSWPFSPRMMNWPTQTGRTAASNSASNSGCC